MNFFKTTITFLVITFLISCNKESITTSVDNEPEVPVEEVTINSNSTVLTTFILDSVTMEINNYSLAMNSSLVGAPGAIFTTAWFPLTEDEMELQEVSYDLEFVDIVSTESWDAYRIWVDAGSNPATEPDIDLEPFGEVDLVCTVSNITDTTANILITGSIVDSIGVGAGDVHNLSGSFTAILFETQ